LPGGTKAHKQASDTWLCHIFLVPLVAMWHWQCDQSISQWQHAVCCHP